MPRASEQHRQSISSTIVRAATDWAQANCDMSPSRMFDMFCDSSDFRFAENGVIFAAFGEYKEFVEGFYKQVSAMSLTWQEIDVLPLSSDVAVLMGVFEYQAALKTGTTAAGRNAFTGVFVRREGMWKIVYGHESSADK